MEAGGRSRPAARATLGGLIVGHDRRVGIIGVLNVSPESFYGGSVHTDPDDLRRASDAMVAAGADILDIGALSSAPYLSTTIGEGDEEGRLATAVACLAPTCPVPLSVDTSRSGPARAALDAGASIVNDVSGLAADPEMASLIAERGAGVILMASPRSGAGATAGPPIETVARILAERLACARAAGIGEERIVLDPGIGFFRDAAIPWFEWDAAVIARLRELEALGRPLCVGVSRKSFIGILTGRAGAGDRLAGSLAATAVAVLNGALLIRTHDPAETRDAIRVAQALRS